MEILPLFLPLFVTFAGWIIGLGALTVIDLHGWLGQTSGYWTEATTRTHKVTKPLIWLGLSIATIGSIWLYSQTPAPEQWIHIVQATIWPVMVLNGCFLSFWVSPRLLKREAEGKSNEILPLTWRRYIFASFIFSFVCWWSQIALLCYWIALLLR